MFGLAVFTLLFFSSLHIHNHRAPVQLYLRFVWAEVAQERVELSDKKGLNNSMRKEKVLNEAFEQIERKILMPVSHVSSCNLNPCRDPVYIMTIQIT